MRVELGRRARRSGARRARSCAEDAWLGARRRSSGSCLRPGCARSPRRRGAATSERPRRAARRTRERRNTNPPSARGSGCAASDRSSDSGLPSPPPSQARAQWRRGGEASPLTAAGPSRTCTGVPLPLAGLERESSIERLQAIALDLDAVLADTQPALEGLARGRGAADARGARPAGRSHRGRRPSSTSGSATGGRCSSASPTTALRSTSGRAPRRARSSAACRRRA